MIRPPPRSPLFPYTTLSRSRRAAWWQRLAPRHARGVTGDPPRRRSIAPDRGRTEWKPRMTQTVEGMTDGMRLRSEEHTSELQSQSNLVCRLLLEKKKKIRNR